MNSCNGCYVGTNLESRIPRIFKSRSCNCDKTKSEINALTPEEVEGRFDFFASILVQNAKRYAIPEALSRPKAEKWLRESIEQAKEARAAQGLQQRNAIDGIKQGHSLSDMLNANMRLQRGVQGIPPEDGNLPR